MQRRRISINGRNISDQVAEVARLRQLMANRFSDSAYLSKFIDVLMRSGWTSLDIDSAVKQESNSYRPAVQAFLFHNEHVLDQLRLTQGTYTHMRDTADDPNYALRHSGQAELMFRRMTPGDLLMLDAAQRMSAIRADFDCPSELLPDYWQELWKTMLDLLSIRNDELHRPYVAAASVLETLLRRNTMDDVLLTFLNDSSRYFCGVRARRERRRTPEAYETVWVFAPVNEEQLYMLSCIGLAYSMDDYARMVMESGTKMRRGFHWHQDYLAVVSDPAANFMNYTVDHDHGNQETNEPARPVNPSRLLP